MFVSEVSTGAMEPSGHNYMPFNETSDDSATHRRIVAAARRSFFTNGPRSVTMDELARELGMSKKTLYEHFPSKTELVRTVILDKFRDLDAEMKQIAAQSSSDFRAALQHLLAYLHRGEIQPVFFRDISRETPEMFRLVENQRIELVQRYFREIFVQGSKAGIIRDDVQPELVTEILLAAVRAVMTPEKLDSLKLGVENGFSAIIQVILQGIVTAKGRSELCPAATGDHRPGS